MAAHPRCPCTRASTSELVQVLTQAAGRVEAFILVFSPERPKPTWVLPDRLRRLETIPGVHLIDDPGGVEAARFAALTSGYVALFAPGGRLLFHGGITRARGHEGNNAGRQALLDLIREGSTPFPSQAPVFGCPVVQAPPTPAGGFTSWSP
jgi:hypothetical protein